MVWINIFNFNFSICYCAHTQITKCLDSISNNCMTSLISSFTPVILIDLFPKNLILAPELFKKLIKSITSGSIEIFFIT